MADTSVDVKDTIDIVGLNDIKANLTLNLPQPFNTENATSLEIKPLKADIGTTTHLAIDPLKLDLQLEPLKTDSSLSLDLKPAVIDLCLTANIGKLPNVCIRQPYQHSIGFSLYGTQVWAFTFSGQQDTVIEELDRQPKVAWRGASASWPPARSSQQQEESKPSPTREVGGLRVRLEP